MSPGDSAAVAKLAQTSTVLPTADVVFALDLTGSMTGELSAVKTQVQSIINGLVAAGGVDLQTGATSFMDYPNSYSSCGHASEYGGSGDVPFAVNQALTSDPNLTKAAISAMSLGDGADNPEASARMLWEAGQPDSGMGFRAGSQRIMVLFTDDYPHDCGVGTGKDPGRNGAMDTYAHQGLGGDDIDVEDDTVPALLAAHVKPLIVASGASGVTTYWQTVASTVGGAAYQINSDGTVPGGLNLTNVILSLIQSASYAQVSLQPVGGCALSFSFSPPEYSNVVPGTALSFSETISVPPGTLPGVYDCDVQAVADGAVFGTQAVSISVPTPTPTATATATPTTTPSPTPTVTPPTPAVAEDAPDLAITKTHSGAFTPDQGGTFTLSIVNVGTLSTTGPITVTDPTPTGLRVVSASGTGWDCSATTPFVVNCTNPGPLAPLDPPLIITVQVSVLLSGPSTVRNTATVSTDGDPNSSNDSGSDTVELNRPALAPAASPAGLAAGAMALIGVAAWGLRRTRRSAR